MNPGDIYTLKHVAKESETAEVLGSGGLPVYSTPSMICLMELTAFKLAESKGFQTVGTRVNISPAEFSESTDRREGASGSSIPAG